MILLKEPFLLQLLYNSVVDNIFRPETRDLFIGGRQKSNDIANPRNVRIDPSFIERSHHLIAFRRLLDLLETKPFGQASHDRKFIARILNE